MTAAAPQKADPMRLSCHCGNSDCGILMRYSDCSILGPGPHNAGASATTRHRRMEKSAHVRGEVTVGLLPSTPLPAIEWRISDGLTGYEEALAAMTARAGAIARGDAPELVWLLEHAPLYTAGTSAQPDELIEPRFPVHKAGRGGQFTYHGPGQRVGYV